MTSRDQFERRAIGVVSLVENFVLFRILQALSPVAIILGVTTFMLDLEDVIADRSARSWELVNQAATGNSGKIEALEYLNKHNPLTLPNPRRWGLPLGPETSVSASGEADAEIPRSWVLLANYGPWKSRTPLIGIDLWPGNNGGVDDTVTRGAYLAGIDLSSAILLGSDLTRANLYAADLSEANLVTARLDRAVLERATLAGAKLDRVEAELVNLSGADLRRISATSADFSRAVFRSADLSGADLYFSNLSGAKFGNANLAGANLKRANLANADLTGATVDGANISSADLRGVQGLNQARLDTACGNDFTKLPEHLTLTVVCAES